MNKAPKAETGDGSMPRVIFIVTRAFSRAGLGYLGRNGHWVTDHDDAQQFPSESAANEAARDCGGSVECSATIHPRPEIITKAEYDRLTVAPI